MRSSFLRQFPPTTGLTQAAPVQIITLTGLLPAYTSPPLIGQDVDTNLVPADTADFASTAGTIATVDTLIRVEVSPDSFNEYPYQNGFLDPVQPGDRLTPISVVTDSVANTDRFSGLTVTIALPAPTITSQPVLPAVLVAGMTTFNVDFGSAGPSGESGFLGVYNPTLTRTFTINGADRTSELTLISGANYTWNGASLPVNAVVSVRATWTNATGTIQSSIVNRTAGALFQISRDDLTYEAVMTNAEGIVTGNVTSPTPYATYAGPSGAGTFSINSVSLATGPVVMFPPVVADVAGTFTLTQEAVWTRANAATGFTQGGQWWRDGVAVSGQTSPTYSGAAPVTSIEWRATASDSNGSRVQASNVLAVGAGVKTRTFLWGGSNNSGGSQVYTPDLTAATSGDTLIVVIGAETNQNGAGTITMTLGANSGTLINGSNVSGGSTKARIFSVVHPGGTPSLTFSISGASFVRSVAAVEKVTNNAASAITSSSFATNGSAGPGALDLNVATGNLLYVVVAGTGNNGSGNVTTGAGSAVYSNTIPTNALKVELFAELATATQTPRDIETTWSATARIGAAAVTI